MLSPRLLSEGSGVLIYLLRGEGGQGARVRQAPIGEMALFEGGRYRMSQPPNALASERRPDAALRNQAQIPA